MNKLKLKICGLRNNENIKEIAALNPDFTGFIFYDKSARFVGNNFDISITKSLSESSKKVGVFVNSTIENIHEIYTKYQLDFVQLHGNETIDFCEILFKSNFKIIKAFSIDEDFDFNKISGFAPYISYFLFDTKTIKYGGSGIKFNWYILMRYQLNFPFFLSGGISVDDAENIIKLKQKNQNLYGVDINSKFELEPGIKDVELVTQFIMKLEKLVLQI